MALWPWTVNAVLRERLAALEAAHARLVVDHGLLQRKHDRLVDQCLGHAGVTHEPIRDLPPSPIDPLNGSLAAVFRNLGRQTANLPLAPTGERPDMTG